VTIAEYTPEWSAQFAAEAADVRRILGPRVQLIEHVGSTSVPGLAAKAVIDILLVLANSSDESRYVPDLEAAGYVLRVREPEWYEHRMFNGPGVPTNLHVFSARCPEIERMLTFRDWLRHNADDREMYARAKRSLAERQWPAVDDYASAKTDVVMEIMTRADARPDVALVRQLLREQHADLSELPLDESGAGWDNAVFRAGEQLAVRLPRRATSARLVTHEQRWLPQLSPQLPLPIPAPVRLGRPSARFPWPWSVVPWLPGHSMLAAQTLDDEAVAVALGTFLHALHRPAPPDAPFNAWRGVDLAARTELFHRDVTAVAGAIDSVVVVSLWQRLAATPAWRGPRLWIHGDLHPGNLLVENGRLSAVVDFGDLTAGDPATDLSVAWMLPTLRRSIFRSAARSTWSPVDDDTWHRARGWALALGVAYLAASQDDKRLAALARTTIDAALREDV
jgi:GrpB-like predicted nucleotidyltransferase (UPF0157 family)/aminoglycoside phosphotransferase (APT) family kinase protein